MLHCETYTSPLQQTRFPLILSGVALEQTSARLLTLASVFSVSLRFLVFPFSQNMRLHWLLPFCCGLLGRVSPIYPWASNIYKKLAIFFATKHIMIFRYPWTLSWLGTPVGGILASQRQRKGG